MDELALYVLDITMNSVRAGATEITITTDREPAQDRRRGVGV